MLTVNFRGEDVQVATCLEDLTPQQYRYWLTLVSALSSELVSRGQMELRWFSYLAGLERADVTLLKPELRQRALDCMPEVMAGFFSDGEPRLTSVCNLLPEYDGYKGPRDCLAGLEYGRFTACMAAMERVGEAPEERRECYQEIARQLYSIPEDKPVPDMLSLHAPLLFGSVWQMIQSGPITVNGRKVDLSIIFKTGGQSRPDDHTGWTGITFEVASSGVFGTVADVERTDFWDVLMYLYKCKFEYNYEQSKIQK